MRNPKLHEQLRKWGGGIELLPHPSYSPDLAPSYCHLLRSMAHFLRERNFENIEAMEMDLTKFFA